MFSFTTRLALLATIAILSQPTALLSQAVRSGSLSGVVRTNGVPAANVTVAISSDSRVFTTDRAGTFSIPLLPAGDYSLTIEHLGHRPLLVTGVRVSSGVDTPVDLDLQPLNGGPIAVDTLRFAALDATPVPLAPLQAEGRSWRRAVSARQTFADLAGEYGYLLEKSVDGLPLTSGTRYVDGVALPIDPDEADAFDLFRFPLPRLAVGSASLTSGGSSINAGEAGIAWSVTSLPAPTSPTMEWSGAGGRRSSLDPSAPSFEGSVFGGARFAPNVLALLAVEAGVDDRRQPAFTGPVPDMVAGIGRTAFGADSWSDDPFDLETLYSSSIAGVDWRNGSQALQVRARLATRSFAAPGAAFSWIPSTGASTSTTAGLSFALESAPATGWSNTLQGGFESRRRSGRQASSPADETWLAATHVTGLALGLGADPTLGSGFTRSTASIANQLRFRLPNHSILLELGANGSRYLFEDPPHPQSDFVFGGVEDLDRGVGGFTAIADNADAPEFEVARLAGGIEERWTPRGGLELLLGLRAESELRRPPATVPEPLWFLRTGMSYTSPTSTLSILPRVGLSAVGGPWQLIASAAMHTESVQPRLLNEIYSELGTTRVRRRLGTLPAWPAPPDSIAAPFYGSRLTLTDPSFTSPRTLRGNLSISRSLGAGSRMSLSGSYRWTDRLPRRYDLNRVSGPTGQDQYGRALYGKLGQEGTLVGSEPGSSRRISGFDVVSLLKSDGESRYAGVTVELEQSLGRRLRVMGTYTFSETLDNLWLEGSSRLNGAPYVPELEQGEWVIGTSDFDVPHRARVGLELTVPALRSLEIATFYRIRSGYPFTPGFAAGADVNGDQIQGNEPAYLDASLPGYSELASRWSCLAEEPGFVARNACRAPSVSAVDLRVSLPLGGRGEVYLDAYQLFGGELRPDAALYLIDPNARLTTDTNAVSTVPLIVNPTFGDPLLSAGTSRSLRLGLDVRF